MSADLGAQVEAVEAHARRVAARSFAEEECGPFSVFWSPEPDAAPSYAVAHAPLGPPDSTRAALAALEARFAARAEPCRVEVVLLTAATLAGALEDRGYAVEEESPLWLVTPETFRPRPRPGVHLRWVDPRDDLAFVGAVIAQGFELRGASPMVEQLKVALESGVRWALAEEDLHAGDAAAASRPSGRHPSGSGCVAVDGDVAELSLVSTLPTRRKHGVAGAVVTFLVAGSFAAGGRIVWASPGEVGVGAALQTLGFDDAGLKLRFGQVRAEGGG